MIKSENLPREKGSVEHTCPDCGKQLSASEPLPDGSVTFSHDDQLPAEHAEVLLRREQGTDVPSNTSSSKDRS